MDEADALRQQLRDEAAWRTFLEDELAREAEKAATWRTRAEERAARIDRLVAGRSIRQALAARLAGPHVEGLRVPDVQTAVDAAAAAAHTPSSTQGPHHPEVRTAALVAAEHLRGLVAEFDHRDLADGREARRDADLIAIEDAAWEAAAATHDAVLAWLEEDRRPPLLWWGAVPDEVAARLRPGDRTAAADGRDDDLPLAPWGIVPGTAHLPRDAAHGRWVETDDARVLGTQHGPALAVLGADSPHRALALARTGVPVIRPDGGPVAGLPGPAAAVDLEALGRGAPLPPTIRRMAIRQRRAVERDATAAHRAGQLLAALGVPHVVRAPRLCVLLSSNRPALVADQVASLAAQARRPDEIRLAFHGGADVEAYHEVEAAADGIPLHVTEPAADVPLGTVLNDLADVTAAELLAKIDDDDHYGPHHLADAVAALDRTGAALVGRKAHYVHLTGEGRTWLLAEDAEDAWTQQGIMGATFVWRRALFDEVRFSPRPRRVDSLYVRASAAAGAGMYALPANDFAYVRDPGGRTNVAGGSFVRARGRDIGPGLPLDVVDV